jgi:lipopolysaccharide export LptBFGC system permease protein LptF
MSGYKATRYEVDLHSKLALPLASLLMVMIATSSSRCEAAGPARHRFCRFIAFIYWGLVSVGTASDRSGALPPGNRLLANVFLPVGICSVPDAKDDLTRAAHLPPGHVAIT